MAESGGEMMWEKWLRQWLQSNAGPLREGEIKDALWNDLNETFKKLVDRFTAQESREIMDLCGDVQQKGFGSIYNKKEMCKGMAEIRYFMNGLRKKDIYKMTPENNIGEDELYKRCIVGVLAMLEFYPGHCQFGEVTEYINKHIDAKINTHGRDGENRKCSNITVEDLIIGKTVVGTKIKEWTEQDRTKAKSTNKCTGGVRRVGNVICIGEQHCEKESKLNLQNLKNDEKENITKLLGLKETTPPTEPNQPTVLDVLTSNDPKFTLSKEDLEKAFKDVASEGEHTLESGKIEQVIRKLEDSIQQKIQGTDFTAQLLAAPLAQPVTSAQTQQLHRDSPQDGGLLATLSSALSVPGTAIPAVAGAMALPAFLFASFLYKKHKRSGNNRKKRSLRREYYGFDDDDDDTSTDYSRSNLTAGTNSSEYSIPYTLSSSSLRSSSTR